ncbi:MAG: carboxylating nicotinate-nucleotide diphosphorylase [Phycisphaeraceae bacterium]|nr:carboxylating nicotinate-nucleotide diphosphorylase [Phycisphaeraceae bacterium]
MPASDTLNTLPLPDLFTALSRGGLVRRLLELARDEDLGCPLDDAGHVGSGRLSRHCGDITTQVSIDPAAMATASLRFRRGGIVCGLATVPMLLEIFAPACTARVLIADGSTAPPGHTAATVSGPLDEILGLERTLLNLVGRLSGVATRTAEYAGRIPAGSRARLYDTRKTTPGMRVLEKYAVRCGGGRCHRMGLFDAVLLKDNHLAGVGLESLAEVVREAATRARADHTPAFIEVEVDTLEQFERLLSLPSGVIDIVLLDNMSPATMARAALMRDAQNPRLELEASGGITLDTIAEAARAGVDRISVGALTHGATSIDVGLDIDA